MQNMLKYYNNSHNNNNSLINTLTHLLTYLEQYMSAAVIINADFRYTAAVYEFYSLHPRRVVY